MHSFLDSLFQVSNVYMRRIAVASGKGGVGRTTIAANLGIALASLGKSTIVVDSSLMTPNLAILFKLEKAAHTINDVLSGVGSLKDVLYNGPKGIKIATASLSLELIKRTQPENLPDILRDPALKVDFVIIDAPVGIGRETVAAIRSAQETLLVATPDVAAVSDCMKTKLVAEFLGAAPLGIVLNRVRKEEFELSSKEIEKITKLPVLVEIPEDDKVKMALKNGTPLLTMEPKAKAAKALTILANKIAKKKNLTK